MSDISGKKLSPETVRTLENLRQTAARLREKSDTLEDELSTLKAEQQAWCVERRRLERELEVKDDTINDLTRDLSLCKDNEAKAMKRYDKVVEYNRKNEEMIDELTTKFDCEREELMVKLRELKVELMDKEDELEKFRRRNEDLGVKLGEMEVLSEKLGLQLNEKDVQVCDLQKKCAEFEDELKELQSDRDEAVDNLLNRVEMLETELLEVVTNKEKAGLEREKTELIAKLKTAEESLSRLESDVIAYLCLNVKHDDRLASSRIGTILSRVIEAIDEEQEHRVGVKGEMKTSVDYLEEDLASATHVNDMKRSLVTKSVEVAKTEVISVEELAGDDGDACNKTSKSPACIDISDSDDDEISCRASGIKRQRAASVSSIPKNSGVSSDDSLNPKRKIKKLEHVVGEPDDNFHTPRKQILPAIRACEENLSRKVKTPGFKDSDRKDGSRSKKTDVLEYMAKCQQKLEKNALECVADMALACEKDAEFCAKAVCALYRSGLLSSRQSRFDKRDIDRATALAKRIVDCGSNSDKKSIDELKLQDPGGLGVCRKLARGYSDKLFEIFTSNKDPCFSRLSTNVQYR